MMNKTLLLGVLLGAATISSAQQNQGIAAKRIVQQPTTTPASSSEVVRGTSVWSDDFSNPSNWVIARWPGSFALDWEIGVGLTNSGSFPTEPITSTTASNGYAMYDSDGGNNNTGNEESAFITTAQPIDLSMFPSVILEFENYYRRFNPNKCFVVISTNNTDWPNLNSGFDANTNPNVFEVFATVAVNGTTANPEVVSLNITDIAGGQSQVWVRFHWTGSYGYTWFIDDVAVIEQPENDMVMNYGYVSHNGEGTEFGRVPSGQLYPSMNVGAEVFNFGVQPQTNVTVEMSVLNSNDVEVFSATENLGTLASGDTAIMDQDINLPTMPEGTYRAFFSVSSDQSDNEGTPANNAKVRTFAIDNNVYSMDGIDVYPNEELALTSLGSNSFTDAEDGLIIMTYYEFNNPATIYGVDALLAVGTEVNSSAIFSIHTEENINAEIVNQPVAESEFVTVTMANMNAGFIRGLFPGGVSLAPGNYYAAVELFSNGGDANIRILDDLTVPQPFWASYIYIPGDQVYSNGNASAVRMMLNPTVGISEAGSELSGVSMYPNPTEGQVWINTEHQGNHLIEVTDMVGALVYTGNFSNMTTIDLGDLSNGMYVVRVVNDKGSVARPIVVQ